MNERITLTVNGQPAEPGCYVEGSWGQYGGQHLLEQAEGFETLDVSEFNAVLTTIRQEWPKNNDGSLCGAYGSDRDAEQGKGTGPWAAIQNFGDTDGQTAMELANAVLNVLDEHTEGGYWEWWEGEVFLRSYICPECGRDATHPDYDPTTGKSEAGLQEPCDYCCDADS